jgi:hypothetical protein
MEAVWTRFQPLVIEIERLVRDEKAIGDVRRVYADLGFDADLPNLPADSRMISPKLAGGGLLDLGPYPLLWALLVCAGPEAKPPSRITSSIQFTDLKQIPSQVDKHATWIMNWDDEGAQAICTTSIATETSPTAVTIQGSKGEDHCSSPLPCRDQPVDTALPSTPQARSASHIRRSARHRIQSPSGPPLPTSPAATVRRPRWRPRRSRLTSRAAACTGECARSLCPRLL